MRTDTAHLAWNEQWANPQGQAEWGAPEPEVVALADKLNKEKGHIRVLDLGCGVGRHALHFARLGFETIAVDLAPAGLAEVSRAAAAEGLELAVQSAAMTELPFPDGHFDYVLSFNVIYHGDRPVVARAVSEIHRVLKPGGVFQGTLLSKRNHGFGMGTEIAPNTFVRDADTLEDIDSDKIHPHFYCNAAELVALLEGFELYALEDREQSYEGHWHWHLTAERLP